MTLWTSFKHSLRSLLGTEDDLFLTWDEGVCASDRDTLAAILALNQEVRNDPDSVEIYLALGNLYRARGDIERAIQIRNGLLVRHGLDNRLKARVYFELGLDYKRGGFVDRAFKALEEALEYGGPEDVIRQEIAMLYADSGNYPMAVKAYAKLGQRVAEAYYLSLISDELFVAKKYDDALVFAKRAVRASASSVEAWLQRIKIAALNLQSKDTPKILRHAFMNIKPEVQFMLLDSLLSYADKMSADMDKDQATWRKTFSEYVVAAIPDTNLDALLNYYKGLFLLRAEKTLEAGTYFEKAIISEPEFWAARLELLAISFSHQNTSPMFNEQIDYFLREGRRTKRFVCVKCGFKRDALFFSCPRCRSWHSAIFRRCLKD